MHKDYFVLLSNEFCVVYKLEDHGGFSRYRILDGDESKVSKFEARYINSLTLYKPLSYDLFDLNGFILPRVKSFRIPHQYDLRRIDDMELLMFVVKNSKSPHKDLYFPQTCTDEIIKSKLKYPKNSLWLELK